MAYAIAPLFLKIFHSKENIIMKVSEVYGSMVFGDSAMRERLPKEVYKRLRKTIDDGKSLDPEIAGVVANAMKDWAISLGATHFTHWFQPMTGVTAEKHDSFISLSPSGIIMEFSGKELIKGESDASSFPNGGIRATFEARGYTAWDATSYAFVKDKTLYIPTAFCSYGGEALDKKTPLLRSMETINKHAMRIMKLFGNEDVKRVYTTVGAEQEYFLIDKALFDARKDLSFTGRTLFGAKPPKGQEMEDHYYGCIKPRVKEFMDELDEELWKLGIPAKTEHNEVAPSQHEVAVVYTTTNTATDNNQLMMEMMKKIAPKHGLACLLHEKPFAGVNGSGKHNNWSIATDTGVNLLEPGETPYENAQFLLFLCAVIRAVDKHQDLLRISVSSAGNDHRLGANEAPPAVISMFLGDELTAVLEAVKTDAGYSKKEADIMRIGVHTLPKFPRDMTDRNRTSPFAFTGNKFEFRMPGSSLSIADVNTVLNTIVAESLDDFATALENTDDFERLLHTLIQDTIKEHGNIIFNGNNYSADWLEEAKRRGLLNLPSTPDALKYFVSDMNKALFEKYRILSGTELVARHEILLENYCKTINIEALTMLEMVKKDIIPAISEYTGSLASSALAKRNACEGISTEAEESIIRKLGALLNSVYSKTEALSAATIEMKTAAGTEEAADFARSTVFVAMQELRAVVDEAETFVGSEYWPLPTYSEMLFSV